MKILKVIALIFIFLFDLLHTQRVGRFMKADEEAIQKRFDERFFYSIWLNPVQYEENLILNYNIRYDYLLFEKVHIDTFKARVKVILELSSPDILVPIRNIDEVVIKSTEFNQTISKEIYYTSSFSLKVPNKNFRAILTLLDETRNKEISVQNFNINLEDTSNFEPIFIKASDLEQIGSKNLKNRFYNFLPFEPEKYLLILPDKEEFSSIEIKDDFTHYKLSEKVYTGFKYSIYSLDKLDLIEGEFQLRYSNADKSRTFFVRWVTKPDYLKNPEKANKVLKYLFESEDKFDKLPRSEKDRLRKFYSLWKKFDPTPETPFNELMAEFYRRADFASSQFRSVSQPDGALTDRGKIYLIYGQPDSIEKSFAKDGRAIETWIYNSNKNLKFTFFDENKNGNYILQQ